MRRINGDVRRRMDPQGRERMSSYDLPDADPDSTGASSKGISIGAWPVLQEGDPHQEQRRPLDATQRIEHLWRVHRHTQETIELCDKKSSVLIALAGSVIAGLLSAT